MDPPPGGGWTVAIRRAGTTGEAVSPNTRMDPFVIFNPASGRGRGAQRIPLYRELLGRHLGPYRWASTEAPGEEAALAERALASGARLVIAVGGDGTWSQVADRVAACGRRDVDLGLLAAGTGNDFARSLGIDYGDPERAVVALAAGRTRRIDVGRVVDEWRPCARPEGAGAQPWRTEPRHFLNHVGFGFDVAVIDAARRIRFLKGEPLYKLAALGQLFSYPGLCLKVSDDDDWLTEGRRLLLTVSNGRVFGGGLPIAPHADLQDGRLDVCAIANASPLRRARLFGLAVKGRHLGATEVSLCRNRTFTVRHDGPLRYEVDGDVLQSRSGTICLQTVPGGLSVIVP